ncbi:MAG: nitroreductase family deazaflavin-dependent oxidoreductase [Acidimicrobiia bacterium]|nr:nitroreductase family deazaflavin-dependent oxidoreductase [Acidimicrobiia bacterium]
MPLPRWLAQINKHTFNKMEVKKGERPVLIHEGRSSGRTYETPLDAHAVDGGYIFIVNYGARSDWVKNILAAGRATLRLGAQEIELSMPRLLTEDEALSQMSPTAKPMPGFLNITEYLHMHAVA